MQRVGMLAVYSIAVGVFVTVLLSIVWAMGEARKQAVRQIEIDIDDDLLPGQPVPDDAYCQFYIGENCAGYGVRRRGGFAGITPDQKKIRRVYYIPLERFSVGDLLLAVGAPVWIKRTGRMVYLGWPDGNITVSWTRAFRPETSVGMFLFGKDVVPAGTKQWQGFVR